MTTTFFHLLKQKFKGLPKILREILYGMTIHEMDLELKRERGSLDHLCPTSFHPSKHGREAF
jgi:hypothetical protein